MTAALLLVAALAYAVACGANDGGMLVGLATRTGTIPPLLATVTMVVAVIAGPFVIGTTVANTLAHGLVSAAAPRRSGTVLVLAVLVSVLVVLVLSRWGLPTSLTLALVGGIVGAGLGAGLAVGWSRLVYVLVVALLAPLVAGGLAWVVALGFQHVPSGWLAGRGGAYGEVVVLLGQAVAYSATGAQAMVAILGVLADPRSTGVPVSLPGQLAVGAAFGVGLLVAVPRTARVVSERFVHVRRPSALISQSTSTVACLVSAGLGAPVSLTQATTGALLGGELRLAPHRVRWTEAVRIGRAWVLTLPTALAASWVLGLAWTAIVGRV
ncbi:MAG: inorganic phosphate transporter [Actinomycetes bacterium]